MNANHFRPSKTQWFLFAPLLLCLSAVLFLSASFPATSAGAADSPSPLESQVREWKDILAASPPFLAWKEAEAEIQALGPGTHGWLAILNKDGQAVGYMVVHATEDGSFRLGEYGVGPHTLFSPADLRRTLIENGLLASEHDAFEAVRQYFHPFAALWEVRIGHDTYWVDAKTDEILPFERESWERLRPTLRKVEPDTYAPAQILESSYVGKTFDPYENLPWLTGSAPSSADQNGEKVQSRIRGGLHLRFVTEPYGDAALYAVPVIGYQAWAGGRLDLALDMSGSRFIPMAELRRSGDFYE